MAKSKKLQGDLLPLEHKNNIETLRLLALHPGFLVDAAMIRREFGIPPGGFINKVAAHEWRGSIGAGLSHKRWYVSLPSELTKKYRVTANLGVALMQIILMGNPGWVPLFNYSISPAVLSQDRETIQIKVYGRLSKFEEQSLIKEIKHFQTFTRPRNFKRTKTRSQIERDIEILSRSSNKGRMTDADLAAHIFKDVTDDSLVADRRRAQTIKQARRRLRLALKERFG